MNRESPPRWRNPASQVATASSVLNLAQSGWVITPALLITGSTDEQADSSIPVINVMEKVRKGTLRKRKGLSNFSVQLIVSPDCKKFLKFFLRD